MNESQVVAAVLGVAAEVLGVDPVDPDQDFFALGGDSLLAVELVVRLADLGLTAELRDIFVAESLGQLAQGVADQNVGAGS